MAPSNRPPTPFDAPFRAYSGGATGNAIGMTTLRAPLELGDRGSFAGAIDMPDWARRLPRALWLALASALIPGYSSRWL